MSEKALELRIMGPNLSVRQPNALSACFSELEKDEITNAIVECGHNPDIRGEKLSIEQFVTLADKLYELIKAK